MADKEWETDEDEMIYHLEVHKNLIGWIMDKLKKAGIPCERTKGRDRNGDILDYIAKSDESLEIVNISNLR